MLQYTMVCMSLLYIFREEKTKLILFIRSEFTFLQVNIYKIRVQMLVMFSPIFVTDTKITFVYNFTAPLMHNIKIFLVV